MNLAPDNCVRCRDDFWLALRQFSLLFHGRSAPPLDPAVEAKMDPNLMMKVVGDHAPPRGLPVKHPLMHRTRTVDYAVVLSGEIDIIRRRPP